jgi:hypothetical protein
MLLDSNGQFLTNNQNVTHIEVGTVKILAKREKII